MKINVRWWMNGEKIQQITTAAAIFWGKIRGWLFFVFEQKNPETCHLTLLHLLAWQRGIQLFATEPERLYRLRVKHAFINYLDAGSVVGFSQIFLRLGLGRIDITERLENRDFDVVEITIYDDFLAENSVYLNWLIQTYGRTCRRYQWKIINKLNLSINSGIMSCVYQNHLCRTVEND